MDAEQPSKSGKSSDFYITPIGIKAWLVCFLLGFCCLRNIREAFAANVFWVDSYWANAYDEDLDPAYVYVINPPFSDFIRFTRWLDRQYLRGCSIVIVLSANSNGTGWFDKWLDRRCYQKAYPRGKPGFVKVEKDEDQGQRVKNTFQPMAILLLQPEVYRYRQWR